MTNLVDSGDPEWLNASDIDFNVPYGRQIQEVIEAYSGIGYVAGGAARYLLVPDAPGPGDIDVFTFGPTLDYHPLTQELEYDFYGGVVQAPLFQRNPEELRVQVVRPDPDSPIRKGYGVPLEVLQSFTFHTEQAAIWCGAKGTLAGLLSVKGWESTQAKALTNNVISNPILSMFRINKYGQKGFSINMESVLEIATALNELSEEDFGLIAIDALSMVS